MQPSQPRSGSWAAQLGDFVPEQSWPAMLRASVGEGWRPLQLRTVLALPCHATCRGVDIPTLLIQLNCTACTMMDGIVECRGGELKCCPLTLCLVLQKHDGWSPWASSLMQVIREVCLLGQNPCVHVQSLVWETRQPAHCSLHHHFQGAIFTCSLKENITTHTICMIKSYLSWGLSTHTKLAAGNLSRQPQVRASWGTSVVNDNSLREAKPLWGQADWLNCRELNQLFTFKYSKKMLFLIHITGRN